MALVFTATKLTKNNLSVVLNFNLTDNVAPLVILGAGEVTMTLPPGQTEASLRAFVAAEGVKHIQPWYNTWKAANTEATTNQTRCTALSTSITAAITL